MRILITNDDGVNAKELVPLIKWCRKLGEVTVFVPKQEQSGKSHSFEIRKPFEVKEVELEPGVKVWTVDSSPADCVRVAMLGFKKEFDLAISGVNRGFNLGSDCMYSGTVGAASEAVNQGMKAIALSTPFDYYDTVGATAHLDQVFGFIQKHGLLDKHDFYNINIPEHPKGIRITRQGGPYYTDDYIPVGHDDLYRPTGVPVWVPHDDCVLDADAIIHGYISVTPMTIDKTAKAAFEQLKDCQA